MIEFKENERWMLTLCLLRYSLGRQTYIVGWCNEIIKRNWNEFSTAQKTQIQEEIKNYPFSFSDIDKPSWCEILELPKQCESKK
jgi:hypothetical protein